MKDFLKIDSVVVICITLVLLFIVIGSIHYYVNDRNLMAANIQQAISAGINPLTVRCSYARTDDAVCVAYSFSGGTSSTPKK